MAFAFDRRDETVAHAVRRLAVRLLSQAAADLGGDNAAQSIFAARKSIKKTRAILRLVRSHTPGFDRANAELRDIGRMISASRDAEVIPLTAARLASDATSDVSATLAKLAVTPEAVDQTQRNIQEAASRLASLASQGSTFRVSGNGFDVLEDGLSQAWRKARRLGDRSRMSQRPTDLHEWRKRIKDHWYHARLIRPVWPEMMSVHVAAVGEIAERLGDVQDIHVLLGRVTSIELSAEAREAVEAHANRHADRLEVAARTIADRLFADDTDAVVRRWRAWWKLWQSGR